MATDKQMKQSGATLDFGIDQIKNPTPKWAKAIFRIVSFAVGLWALVQHLNIGLNQEHIKVANEWTVAVVPILHFTIKFFGWDYKTEQP